MSEQTDAFTGQGGSYVRDPETGERTLIERTQSHEEAVEPESEAPPTTELSSEQPA